MVDLGQLRRIFTPTLTNELVVAYGRGELCLPDQQSVDYMHQTDTLRAKYFQNIGSGADQGLYATSIGDYYDFGAFEVFCAANPSFQISSNLNWLKGAHLVKAGFNFFRKQEKDFDYIRYVGFDQQFTRSGSVDGSIGGDSVASLLLGVPSFMQQRYNLTEGDDSLNFVMPYWGFYVEDKWQLNPRWTLSAGLRYDLGIQTYSGNRYGNAIVDMNYDGWQLAIPGRAPGLDLHYLPADKNNFAPRVSLGTNPRRAGCCAPATASSTTSASRRPASRASATGSVACRATSATSTATSASTLTTMSR